MSEAEFEKLKAYILHKKKYTLFLKKRLLLIRSGHATKSLCEKNEVAIKELKTKELILKSIAVIKKLEDNFFKELTLP